MTRIFLFVLMLSALQGIAQERIGFIEEKRCKIDASEYDLVIYKLNNDYLFRVMRGSQVYDVCAFNNVESPDDFKLQSVKFLTTQKDACYVVELAISGSTFGANQFLVIWKESYSWSLSRVPFMRSLLVDHDRDGLKEFQSVYDPHKGFYKFKDGILVAYVPKTK